MCCVGTWEGSQHCVAEEQQVMLLFMNGIWILNHWHKAWIITEYLQFNANLELLFIIIVLFTHENVCASVFFFNYYYKTGIFVNWNFSIYFSENPMFFFIQVYNSLKSLPMCKYFHRLRVFLRGEEYSGNISSNVVFSLICLILNVPL